MRELDADEICVVMVRGATWAVEEGYGFPEDLAVTEEQGRLTGADPDTVSNAAIQRGIKQPGSLGSGNHFCEVEVVDQIYDAETARAFHLYQIGQIVVTIHCGSRGFRREFWLVLSWGRASTEPHCCQEVHIEPAVVQSTGGPGDHRACA